MEQLQSQTIETGENSVEAGQCVLKTIYLYYIIVIFIRNTLFLTLIRVCINLCKQINVFATIYFALKTYTFSQSRTDFISLLKL